MQTLVENDAGTLKSSVLCHSKIQLLKDGYGVIRVVDEPWRVVGHVRRPPKPDVASTGGGTFSAAPRGNRNLYIQLTPPPPLPYFLTKCRSIQAGAALGSAGVSQQAFEHETGV